MHIWIYDVLVQSDAAPEQILTTAALTPTPLPEGEGLKPR